MKNAQRHYEKSQLHIPILRFWIEFEYTKAIYKQRKENGDNRLGEKWFVLLNKIES